jgi:hypothetical protein
MVTVTVAQDSSDHDTRLDRTVQYNVLKVVQEQIQPVIIIVAKGALDPREA